MNLTINGLCQNEDDRIVLASFLDKERQCRTKNIPTSTKFLSPAVQALCLSLAKAEGIFNYGFYGVSEDSERKVCVFYPDYTDFDSVKEGFVTLLRCEKSQRDNLSHRDYLGSILSLGIEREVVGDIFVHENGADIAVMADMSGFLLTNYNKAGRKALDIFQVPHSSLIKSQVQGVLIRETLSSLRLDCVIASVWKLSRSQAEEFIDRGAVSINSLECKTAHKAVKEGDKINLRTKGRCILKELVGTSKKGKIIGSFEIFGK